MGIKSLFKHLLLTTAILSIYACGGGGESSNKTETIIEVQKQRSTNLVFADQNLADCVQALIDSEGYTLVEEIKQLTCSGKEIVDIEGIQNLSSLELLNLSNNQIRDITPISKLGKLKQLNLQGNNLQLLSPITENQLLEQVDISDNAKIICSEQAQLEDKLGDKLTKPEACIEGMQQAETATFEDPNLQACIRQTAQDIGVEHLEQIQQLKCVNHAINDIDGIDQLRNLRELDLTQNNISDITPLQNLALLKKVLLGKNQISNTQPLTTSKYMQELRLDYNQLTDIQDVQTLDALRQIHLTNNQIRDLTPLQSLTGLLELRISNNRIIDIDSLSNLPKLSSLWIQDNQIADLTPLQLLQNLEQLWLSNNWLTDLTPLQTQSKLKWLHLDGTEAADLQPLNKLTQLKWLQLDNTRVDDITAIYPLAQLDWLHLKGNNTIPCSQLDHMEEILTPEKIDRPATCSQPQEQRGTVISTIEFQDQALKDCVYDAAREQGVASADELTILSCTSTDITDITDITELTQFPGITNVDLTGNNHISCAQLDQLQGSIGEALTRPEQCNLPPTVAAQQEQTVTTGAQVDLNAQATDPNGDSLTYNWQQTAGQSVQLTNPNTATPNFTAPQGEDQTITLQLTVTDQYGLSTTQTINILITGAILGSKDNPFLVTSYEDLKKVGTGIDGWNLDSHYLQTANIDATPSKTENPIPEAEEEYYGFAPIGAGETPFTGGYDGGGFEIDGLTINRVEQSGVGLFGFTKNSVINKVNLMGVDIIGNVTVGGLVGINEGIVINSYAAGNVTANGGAGGLIGVNTGNVINSYSSSEVIVEAEIAGGLVGYSQGQIITSFATGSVAASDAAGGLVGANCNGVISKSYATGDSIAIDDVGGLVGHNCYGTIINSYARGNVTGNSQAGGLIGRISHLEAGGQNQARYSNITNSYSTGLVQLQNEELEPVDFGGLVGASTSELNTVSNSFWDIETSEQDTSAGGTAKTSEELKTTTTFTNVDWDFDETWMILSEGYTYPRLAWNTIEIDSWTDLNNMRNNMHANYILTRDLLTTDADYAEIAGPDANDGKGWEPVGSGDNPPFMGTFDGAEFSIEGVFIKRPEEIFVGLFGLAVNADFANVILSSSEVTGSSMVGSLIGYTAGLNSSIFNSRTVDSSILGNEIVGGLIGQATGQSVSIANSSASSNVYGSANYIGGLIGIIDGNSASITQSYAAGSVEGQSSIGGLAGLAVCSVENSYSISDVKAVDMVGGLIGELRFNYSGVFNKIIDSYSNGTVDGSTNVGGLVGLHDGYDDGYDEGEVEITNSFWDIETSGQSTSAGGTGLPTAEMQTRSTFTDAGWDFADVWIMRDYPEFQWDSIALSSIEFIDTALKDCVLETAQSNGWTQSTQVTDLNCSDLDITDTTGLEQLTEITDLDLIGNNHISCNQLDELENDIGEQGVSRPEQCNLPPTISAEEQTVTTGAQVNLTAEVVDPNGDSLTYSWQQTSGQTVELTYAETAAATFTAPEDGEQTLSFQLTVTDPYGLSAVQSINISVIAAVLGTKDNPFLVTSYEDLKKVGTGTDGWNLDSHYLQTADIDATPSKTENQIPDTAEYYGFEPIGNEATPFAGGYDGAGFTIDGLTINRPEQDFVGLFGWVNNGVLSNISLNGVDIQGEIFVAGIAGYILGQSEIESCSVIGVISGGSSVGGVAGLSAGATIKNCDVDVNINAVGGESGGVVGNISGGSIYRCAVNIDIQSGAGFIGGIAGTAAGGTTQIFQSYAKGRIVVTEENGTSAGGLIGLLQGASISQSYFIGAVQAAGEVGGLVGTNESSATIDNSYALGVVEAGVFAGGLVGNGYSAINVTNSYASVFVAADSQAGGLIGLDQGESPVTNSFWNTETSKLTTSDGGTAQSTEKMQARTIYSNAGWDFASIWRMNGKQYPELQWQKTPIFVASYEDLKKIGNDPEWPLDGLYIQTADIDASASTTENPIDGQSSEYHGFEPIGSSERFTGSYDGAGFAINSLYVNRGANEGLFAYVENGYFANITLIGVMAANNSYPGWVAGLIGHDIGSFIDNCNASLAASSGEYVGGLVGFSDKSIVLNSSVDVDIESIRAGGLIAYATNGIIVNSSAKGVINSSIEFSGGLVGQIHSTSIYYSNTDIIISSNATTSGGLVGISDGESLISSSYAIGDVASNVWGGGLVGFDTNTVIERSYATGNVMSEFSGGLVGYKNAGKIHKSFATGNVSGMGDGHGIGGLVGVLSNALVTNSYAKGDVSGETGVAGFIGKMSGNSSVYDSYSSGFVSSSSEVGGLVAIIEDDAVVNNSFWDIETSGIEVSAGGTGLNTAEMQTQSTFIDAGWDFDDIWGYRSSDYPFLQWQKTIYVTSYEDLKKIGVLADWPLDGNYVQLADIDASPSRSEDDGQGFLPIGNSESISFTGSYDGSGYEIDSIYINRPSTQYVGLYGHCMGCSISNVNITGDSSITGRDRVGGLVGMSLGYYGIVVIENSSSNSSVSSAGDDWAIAGGLIGQASYLHNISNSSSTGAVSGRDRVGGLIGLVGDSANTTISKCYATGDVSGDDYVGGLIGAFTRATLTDSYAAGNATGTGYFGGIGGLIGSSASATINNSYSIGSVSAEMDLFGGLIGKNSNTPVNNSFWDIETSGQEVSAGGTGLTTAEMQTQTIFTDAGWDFDDIWRMDGYPKFKWDESSSVIEITSWTELQAINGDLDGHYVLTRDLLTTDAGYDEVAGPSANGGEGWLPLGGSITKFTGSFDGKYYTIDGLYIDRPTTINVGLFGVSSGSTIQNLSVTNVDITGSSSESGLTGGLTGQLVAGGTITNSSATGIISCGVANNGGDQVGGLVGYLDSSTISGSYSLVDVTADDDVGSLVGEVTNGVFKDCYAAGSVSGADAIGGLIGRTNTSNISNCYAIGAVSGVSLVGGLIGYEFQTDTVTSSYWDTQTSGTSTSQGGTGKTTSEMYQQATFVGWDFDIIWEITPESYPVLQ